jgi:hypothetical protein
MRTLLQFNSGPPFQAPVPPNPFIHCGFPAGDPLIRLLKRASPQDIRSDMTIQPRNLKVNSTSKWLQTTRVPQLPPRHQKSLEIHNYGNQRTLHNDTGVIDGPSQDPVGLKGQHVYGIGSTSVLHGKLCLDGGRGACGRSTPSVAMILTSSTRRAIWPVFFTIASLPSP